MGGSLRFTFWDLIAMSYSPGESVHSKLYVSRVEATVEKSTSSLPPDKPIDTVLDATLRNVPLPLGLLTRLDTFVGEMTDSASDPFDWLGC